MFVASSAPAFVCLEMDSLGSAADSPGSSITDLWSSNITSISSDTPPAIPESIPELIEPISKKPKIVRDKITSEKLSVLLASHRKHYEIWSNGRRKAGKQVTPKDIWPKVGLVFLKLAH